MRFIFFINLSVRTAALPLMKPPKTEERNTEINLHKFLLNELHALITDGDQYSFKLDVVLTVDELYAAKRFFY